MISSGNTWQLQIICLFVALCVAFIPRSTYKINVSSCSKNETKVCLFLRGGGEREEDKQRLFCSSHNYADDVKRDVDSDASGE